MVLLRDCLGEVLRAERMERGLTLRELSTRARVSMGYISEVERGHKEASSELLAALCQALGLRLSEVLRQAGETAASTEPVLTPVPLEIASRAELAPVGAERELTSAEVASSEVGDSDVVASAA